MVRAVEVKTGSAALVLVLAAAACNGDELTEFPPGLEPLEDNRVEAVPTEQQAEALVTVAGRAGPYYAHGRGYLNAAPGVVWAASKDPTAMAATCAVTAVSSSPATDATYEYGFSLHYRVDDLLTIEWDEQWRYGTVLGAVDAPELAMIRYQKVFGTEYIYLLEGSIQVLATDRPDWTEVQFIEHLDALSGGTTDMLGSMRQRFVVLQALAHGQPAPPCP